MYKDRNESNYKKGASNKLFSYEKFLDPVD